MNTKLKINSTNISSKSVSFLIIYLWLLTGCMSLHSFDVFLVHGCHRALGSGSHDGGRMVVILLLSYAHDAGDEERSGRTHDRGIQGGCRVVSCKKDHTSVPYAFKDSWRSDESKHFLVYAIHNLAKSSKLGHISIVVFLILLRNDLISFTAGKKYDWFRFKGVGTLLRT